MSTSLAAVNETVSFIATGGGGSGGYTFSWDFGDNTSATGCSSSHAWHATGSFPLLFRVSDSNGHYRSIAPPVHLLYDPYHTFHLGPNPAHAWGTAPDYPHPHYRN